MYFSLFFFFSDRYMINFIKLEEKNFTEKLEIFKSLYSNLLKKNVKFI